VIRSALRRLPPAGTLIPLLLTYVVLVALYLWQASRRETPTIFSDEIEFTQVSRSIADTGDATLRTGQGATSVSLYAYLAAPAWWLSDVSTAYAAIKALGVLLMTATLFPAYALARLVVSRPYAFFAALGAVAAPALSYAPFLTDEPLAYPVSTAALLLIARAGLRPTRASVALAAAACVVAFFTRGQLAVLFPILGLILLARAWRGERMRAWRASWTADDWIGAAVLGVGGAVVLSAALGHRSYTWYVATSTLKGPMLEYGLWALGALAIGLGVVPLIAGLASLVRRRGEPADEGTKTFVALTASALLAFGLYTAIKAAYLSKTLAVVIAERNLIYLCPLLLAGTALVLERRRPPPLATVAATVFAVYLVATTPYTLDRYPNYEAHGLAIAALANRVPRWPADTIEVALVLVALCSGLALAALGAARSRGVGAALAASIAVFALTWSLTTEIYAASGERHASDQQYAVLPKPPDWVDRLTDGQPTLFVGQGISDPNAFWQLEFWNPSIKWLWGMDGSTPGGVTPNLLRSDGTQDPADLGAEFVVASRGVQIAAPQVAAVGGYIVHRVGGRPVRLRETTTGVAADGWMGASASYTRYDLAGVERGFVKVILSRVGACFPQLEPSTAEVKVGPVVVDELDQPAIGTVTAQARGQVHACQPNPLLLPVPGVPWRVEVTVDPTFVPNELDANQGDRRELGAVVAFELVSLRDR